MTEQVKITVPRIESIHIKNYRALRDLELTNLTPLTVFLGTNGSGKSTIFDVFAFLAECFGIGLRKAWDKRNRFRELRSRGATGPIEFELKYRETPDSALMTYYLAIDENERGPFVAEESLAWRRGRQYGAPYKFLDFKQGKGHVIDGDEPLIDSEQAEIDTSIEEVLASQEVLAVNVLGQLTRYPRISALRNFITGWYLSYLSADNTRGVQESGSQEHLSETGDNLPNVIQYLSEQHSQRLTEVLQRLSQRIPRLEQVTADVMPDGRLLLQIKDAPFERPIMAKFASDGTLKMLAYLIALYDPDPPKLIGIEEPENQLHPRLLEGLAEECRRASAGTQLMVTTHSPFFVNGLRPNELWVLYRDEDGYTRAKKASDMLGIKEHFADGSQLGNLWMENVFEFGDPLTNLGAPKTRAKKQQS